MVGNNFLGLKGLGWGMIGPTLIEASVDIFHLSVLQVGVPAFRSKKSLGADPGSLKEKPITSVAIIYIAWLMVRLR